MDTGKAKNIMQARDELLGVANEYRKRQIPIDNIVQDWDYWNGSENWSQLFFDEKLYPNPKEMIDRLHEKNFHIMISVWPGLGPNTPVYKEMQQKGFLYKPVGWAGFKYYDAYNPAANDLYWKYMNKGLFSKGIDAWWFDSTEPDLINASSKESTEYELKRMDNNYLGSFARYLNPYSLLITDAVYKNLRKATDQKRVYILTRSTFAGQQRAAATTWSGDIGANWSIYKNQIPAGLNHSMAGIPVLDIRYRRICPGKLRRRLLSRRQRSCLSGVIYANVSIRLILSDLQVARIGNSARDLGIRRFHTCSREI